MDTSGYILVRPAKRDQALKDFAAYIFHWFEIPNFKEEWVGKGAEVQHFAGSAVGIEITISENPFNHYMEAYKKKGLEKYNFLIHLFPKGTRAYLINVSRG